MARSEKRAYQGSGSDPTWIKLIKLSGNLQSRGKACRPVFIPLSNVAARPMEIYPTVPSAERGFLVRSLSRDSDTGLICRFLALRNCVEYLASFVEVLKKRCDNESGFCFGHFFRWSRCISIGKWHAEGRRF